MTSKGPGGGVATSGPNVGIFPGAVHDLATALDKAVGAAGTLSQAIAQISAHAVSYGGQAADTPELRTVALQAPPVTKEIRTRLRHFCACEKAQLPIDPALYFNNEPPPSAQKVHAALGFFNAHIGDSGGVLWSDAAQGANEVLNDWKTLTATERDAVLNSLSQNQIKELNGQLYEGSSWWGAGSPDRAVQTAFTDLILSSVGPSTLAKLSLEHLRLPLMKAGYPPAGRKGLKVPWMPVSGPLFGPNGPDPYNAVSQGDLGDCYFLAVLMSVAHCDPSFIESHCWANKDGTYTVELYQHGKPVRERVKPDFPWDPKHRRPLFAQVSDGLWVAIYEKACAQLDGSYRYWKTKPKGQEPHWEYPIADQQNLVSGYQTIAGQTPDSDYWKMRGLPGPSVADIGAKLREGHAVIAGTLFGSDAETVIRRDGLGEKIVGLHQYSVSRVYTDPRTGQQMIEMVNPWGARSNATATHVIHLTQAEFQRDFGYVESLPPGGW